MYGALSKKYIKDHVIFCDDVVFQYVSLGFIDCHNINDMIVAPPKVSFLEKSSQTNENYTSAKLHEYSMICSQDNRERENFCHPFPRKISSLKNLFKIRLTRIYFKTIFFDSLPIILAVWIIMLIVLQIQEVSFEIFFQFQSFMELLPPAFNALRCINSCFKDGFV